MLSTASVLAFALALTAVPFARAGGVPDVTINEIRVYQLDLDVDEYFELRGAPGTLLSDVAYIVIGGPGDGYVAEVVDLSDCSVGPSGLFVVAEPTFSLGIPDLVADLNFENSKNVTHMLVYGFTGSLGDDLDLEDDCVLDATLWAAVLDVVALTPEEYPPVSCHYGPPVIGPLGAELWHIYRCEPGGFWRNGRGTPPLGDDTPGAPNLLCLPCPCDCEAEPDDTVDAGDFLALLAQWGADGSCDCEDQPDGTVDASDFLALLAGWGPCPVQPPCPGAGGDCCVANGTPGCSSTPGCCELICSVDPFCCYGVWDRWCRDQANELCNCS